MQGVQPLSTLVVRHVERPTGYGDLAAAPHQHLST